MCEPLLKLLKKDSSNKVNKWTPSLVQLSIRSRLDLIHTPVLVPKSQGPTLGMRNKYFKFIYLYGSVFNFWFDGLHR